MQHNYIFDVDGTLTPSRGVMDVNFRAFFNSFCLVNNVYLVTGSDRAKTIEQITDPTYNLCKRVYNCSGNDIWEKDINVQTNDWTLPEDACEWLSTKLINSDFPLRTGQHFDHRPGMVNFSTVGRGATKEQRAKYFEWDKIVNERIDISKEFNDAFPELSSKVGGETGIDIFAKGCDKGQIVNDFDISSIRFFGDRCDEAGNDYPIAILLEPHQVSHVKDWKHCWEILKNV